MEKLSVVHRAENNNIKVLSFDSRRRQWKCIATFRLYTAWLLQATRSTCYKSPNKGRGFAISSYRFMHGYKINKSERVCKLLKSRKAVCCIILERYLKVTTSLTTSFRISIRLSTEEVPVDYVWFLGEQSSRQNRRTSVKPRGHASRG